MPGHRRGAHIRFLMYGATGNMIHSTVPPHQTNRATVHTTVSEFWFILEGHGEIWRDDGVDSGVSRLLVAAAAGMADTASTVTQLFAVEITTREKPLA